MKLTHILAAAVALPAALLAATPAHAATRPRPVTVTVQSWCDSGYWTLTATVGTTADRLVDVRQTSDMYENALVATVAVGPATGPVSVTWRPGGSAQKVDVRVLAAGSRPDADALAEVIVRDPIQTNPYALC